MKNKTNCKSKCCFNCEKISNCQYKCGESTKYNSVGVPYNDSPNFIKKKEHKDQI